MSVFIAHPDVRASVHLQIRKSGPLDLRAPAYPDVRVSADPHIYVGNTKQQLRGSNRPSTEGWFILLCWDGSSTLFCCLSYRTHPRTVAYHSSLMICSLLAWSFDFLGIIYILPVPNVYTALSHTPYTTCLLHTLHLRIHIVI